MWSQKKLCGKHVLRSYYGLSFAGASVQELREFAQGNAAEISSTVENTMGLFSDDTYKPLFRALEFLNQDNEIDRDEKTATGHVDNLFKVLVENSDEFEKKLRKAIMVSSRMYSGSVALFELMALVNDPKKWAKKIQPQKQQSKAVRAWLEDPRNEHKAKKALAQLVCDGTGKEKKKNKKTANLDSDGGDSSDASCSGKKTKRTASPSSQSEKKACALSSSSDSDAKKKKVKMHQLKKKQKKSVVSDSSSGASSSKKKSSKGKKAKEEKKAKKLADSDESNEEHKATKDKKKKKEKKLADSDDSDEEKKAKKMKKDKKEAKFTLWSQGDVQQASAAAATMLSDIGSNAGGPFGASELMTLLDNAPGSAHDFDCKEAP